MIEMSANPMIQGAIQRAHKERSKAVVRIWGWLFSFR
ncbi:hypothetical protein SAMN05444358_103162 [Ruegeria halocynthiae]|uniref:Uncharacterized protein n=1 Tax=Ruegeria halocynthiae TaxID=985054 RepID=A0A1H2ZBR4_9RHOB|nr:hypothetical protein SAMN05444358_103162 [Ruegeria halocynthiae]